MRFVKDPDSRLDYGLDWSAWLTAGETITLSTWDVDGLTGSDDVIADGTRTVIWLTGGEVGATHQITNHIETSAGRQDDRSFIVKIVER